MFINNDTGKAILFQWDCKNMATKYIFTLKNFKLAHKCLLDTTYFKIILWLPLNPKKVPYLFRFVVLHSTN